MIQLLKNSSEWENSSLTSLSSTFYSSSYLSDSDSYSTSTSSTSSEASETNDKIKELAKNFHIPEEHLQQACKENKAWEFNIELSKTLENYKLHFDNIEQLDKKLVHKNSGQKIDLNTTELMTLTAQAFFSVKNNESKTLTLNDKERLVTRNPQGDLSISKKVALLGKGTYGKALLYENETLGKTAVIKCARRKEGAKAIEDIQNEYDLTLQIGNHRGIQDKPYTITHILSNTKAANMGYIRPDYEGDGTLLIDKPQNPLRLTGEKALDVMHQLFSGLHHLKKHQIGHKDIKPGNLLVRQNGDQITVHLSDFGGAKILTDDSPITNFHKYTYTEDFCSKEDKEHVEDLKKRSRAKTIRSNAFKEEYRKVSYAWDVYSTTVSLYQIFTGILYDPEASAVTAKNKGPFERDRLDHVNLPSKIIDLMELGLKADFTKRPSAKEFLTALDDAIQHPLQPSQTLSKARTRVV